MAISDSIHRRLSTFDAHEQSILDFAKDDLGVELMPVQIFILKVFYSLPLSDSLDENQIEIYDDFNEVLLYTFTEVGFLAFLYATKRINVDKIDPSHVFVEVLLVIGRRGSKTVLSSIITLYTIKKVLMLKDPHSHYGILKSDEIGVALVSNNAMGADRQFRSICALIGGSKFFKRHLSKDPSGGQLFLKSTRLLLDEDKSLKVLGDIIISTFAATPSVRGASNIVTVSDEFGHFIDADVSTKANPLDKLVFEALTPSTSGFVSPLGIPDGKNFFISSPNGEKGMLWSMYNSALSGGSESSSTLMLNMPSHWVNSKLSPKVLRAFHAKSALAYDQEYLGKFIKGVGAWLSPIADKVRACVNAAHLNTLNPACPRFEYFMGIDFGVGHDGTSFAVAHYEPSLPVGFVSLDGSSRVAKDVIIVDYISYSLPEVGGAVLIKDIIKELRNLVSSFNPVKGSYDQWAGDIFTQLIQDAGIRCLEKVSATQQANSDQAKLFRQLVSEGRVVFPNKPDFIEELFRLNEKVSRDGYIKVEDKDFHDDQFDAVCRAVWLAHSSRNSNLDSFRIRGSSSFVPVQKSFKGNKDNIRFFAQNEIRRF